MDGSRLKHFSKFTKLQYILIRMLTETETEYY